VAHRQVWLGGIRCDVKIAPIVRQLRLLGVRTFSSCQDDLGQAFVVFEASEMPAFLARWGDAEYNRVYGPDGVLAIRFRKGERKALQRDLEALPKKASLHLKGQRPPFSTTTTLQR
jgi:hypothetical protein